MPRVIFTPNLKRHVDCPDRTVAGDTVQAALQAVFADHPVLQGYVLDEHQRLRTHMVIFVSGKPIRDREKLSDPVPPEGEIFVMQALSGG